MLKPAPASNPNAHCRTCNGKRLVVVEKTVNGVTTKEAAPCPDCAKQQPAYCTK